MDTSILTCIGKLIADASENPYFYIAFSIALLSISIALIFYANIDAGRTAEIEIRKLHANFLNSLSVLMLLGLTITPAVSGRFYEIFPDAISRGSAILLGFATAAVLHASACWLLRNLQNIN